MLLRAAPATRRYRSRSLLGLAAALLLLPLGLSAATTVQYVYDELGRLIAAIDPAGETLSDVAGAGQAARPEPRWLWLQEERTSASPNPVASGPWRAPDPARPVASGAQRPRLAREWTHTTLELITKHRLSPLRASRVLALLHIAMHDARTRGAAQAGGDRGDHGDRDDEPDGEVGADQVAGIAVHRAAGLVLADLFPQESAERFEVLGMAASLAVPVADGPKADAMWAIGGEVAAAAAARARADGADRVWSRSRRPPPAPGRWRPTPPINSFDPLEPLAGEWRTWVLANGGEVEPREPVLYDSPRFREEVDEVLRVARGLTVEQKKVAETWNLDRGTVTPAGVWNLQALALAEEQGLDDAGAVRMLATLNVAMADAFVACWHAKYRWWTERPITSIRERHDPAFVSHLLTPAFPSYPSGHATASGAAEVVLSRFFPTKESWLRGQAQEAAESRLLGGIHFRSDNEAGLELGRTVGRRVVEQVFGPGVVKN